MKRVIDGKIYDTKTAVRLTGKVFDEDENVSVLFRTEVGNYFICHRSDCLGDLWHMRAISREQAVRFLIDGQLLDVLEKEFPDVVAGMQKA